MKVEKKYRWIKIAGNMEELIFGEKNIAQIELEGKKICVAKTISGLKAFSSKCPHAGGDMSEGKLDKKGNIICPVHGYVFSVNNGRDSSGEGYFLKIYPIKEADGEILIGLQEDVF